MPEVTLRLLGVNRPGLLPGVAQTFAWMNVSVDSFRLERDLTDQSRAIVVVVFRAVDRTCALIRGKLARLIDVVQVHAEIRTDQDSHPVGKPTVSGSFPGSDHPSLLPND